MDEARHIYVTDMLVERIEHLAFENETLRQLLAEAQRPVDPNAEWVPADGRVIAKPKPKRVYKRRKKPAAKRTPAKRKTTAKRRTVGRVGRGTR